MADPNPQTATVTPPPAHKPWYRSLTKWGALLGAASTVMQNPTDLHTIVQAAAVGATIWGLRNAVAQNILATLAGPLE